MKRIRKFAVRLALAVATLVAAACVVGAMGWLPVRYFVIDSRWVYFGVTTHALNLPRGRDETRFTLWWQWKQKDCGCWAEHSPPCTRPDLSRAPPREVAGGQFLGLSWSARDYDGNYSWTFVFPFWMLAAVMGAWPVVALVRWMVWRERRAPGACRACGYDLTGNVSGRCPECGVARIDQVEPSNPRSKSASESNT